VEQNQRRDVGPDEGHHARDDAENSFQEQHPPALFLPRPPNRQHQFEDAVYDRVGPEQQHQRVETQAWPDKGQDSKKDCRDAPDEEQPPPGSQYQSHMSSSATSVSPAGEALRRHAPSPTGGLLPRESTTGRYAR